MAGKTPQFGHREPASDAASRAMQGNRSKNTKPEVMLRQLLWHRGHRYRLHRDDLPGKPDLVFEREKVAVFCDGDFWHGRYWEARKRKLAKGANADYWVPKIRSNRNRDTANTAQLEELGWTFVRIWEGDIRQDPQREAARVEQALVRRTRG